MLSLLIWMACGEAEPMDSTDSVSEESDTDTDADADTDADTDADSDTDSDTDPPDGAELYASRCSNNQCHGATGSSGSGPDLALSVPQLSDEELESVLVDGQGQMEPQGLSRDEVAALIDWLRETFP